MDLSYNEDKEKRRRLTGEKTIRCCGQGENMEKYGFGVDVGGTSCKLGLFTDSGKLMEKWEIPTDTSEQGEHIIEHVAASLERRQRERGLADEQIIGVGIDTPGIAGAGWSCQRRCESGMGGMSGAGAVKDAPAEKGLCLQRRKCGGSRRTVAGRRQGVPRYGDGNAWNGRGRSGHPEWKSARRRPWNRGRDRAYDRVPQGD